MAGSGKTSLMQRMNAYLHQIHQPPYVMNLDPAVHTVPFESNIDIRDSVNYKEVMKQFGLGPNGGIVTSLNLFATQFDQVLEILDSRSKQSKYIIVDTPGQIEVFTWSASGAIITESIAATLPTVIVYCIDTPRCASPVTFMSNMLYACSILYKTKLPFVLAFNKVDVVDWEFASEWLRDGDAFEEAIREDGSYVATLTRSMCMVLQEFYNSLTAVGVSAVSGVGMEELFAAVDAAAQEYHTEYVPYMNHQKRVKVVFIIIVLSSCPSILLQLFLAYAHSESNGCSSLRIQIFAQKQREAAEQKQALDKLKQDLLEGGHVVVDVAKGTIAWCSRVTA
jgi:GPN-loop GTPase